MNNSKYEILSADVKDDILILKIKENEKLSEEELSRIKDEYSAFFPDLLISVRSLDSPDGSLEMTESEGASCHPERSEQGERSRMGLEESEEREQQQGFSTQNPADSSVEMTVLSEKEMTETTPITYRSIELKKQKHLEALEKQRQEGKNKKSKKKEKDPSIIYGSLIKQKPKKITSIEDENSTVCYEGVVYEYDTKITKNNYLMVFFSLVDEYDGIMVRYFLNEKNHDKYRELKNGDYVRVLGTVAYDEYKRENTVKARAINIQPSPKKRQDNSSEKRVEFKVHSNMSQMSGLNDIGDIVKRANSWGHSGILISDEGVVQSYPAAMKLLESGKLADDFKILYGLNAKVIDRNGKFINTENGALFDNEYVVFDIETTGLSFYADEIIEIGAYKIKNKEVVDKFISFVKPNQLISLKTIELTGINDDMVADADPIEVVLPKFKNFCEGAILVAHNANFDVPFIRAYARKIGIDFEMPVIDTLALSRMFVRDIKRHSLDKVAKRLSVVLERHHRAETDVAATSGILLKLIELMEKEGINNFDELNKYARENVKVSAYESYPMTIIVKDIKYLPDFYEIISNSHINRFFREPLYDLDEIKNIREGLILGCAGSNSDLFNAYFSNQSEDELINIINFYDYIEVYPISSAFDNVANNEVNAYNFMLKNYKDYVIKICDICEKLNKPVIAVSNAYYLDREDKNKRTILLHSDQEFKRLKRHSTETYMRTTEEMLEEFSYLGREKAKEIVITNPNKILEAVEQIRPIPDGTFPPYMDGSEEDLKKMCYRTAHEMYGDELPEQVAKRLDRELKAIIGNGYAVMYIIASKIVNKSNEDGYLVGSRGSVGSSFAATTSGITEVNPLPPHYYCLRKPCHYVEFVDEKKFHDGFDLPVKLCPECGDKLHRDGHNIPFETFMGFKGEKEPDIDLNFAGTYQARSHAYAAELFGDDHVFKAGTISTIQGKTAFGYVKKFFEDEGNPINSHYANRFSASLEGIKRTTGQHAGGLMVVPKDKTVYDFSPVQYPSNDKSKGTITTHFDYSTLSGIILKLDLLGHNAPTTIKLLEEYTGVSAFDIGFDDEDTMKIFNSTESLKIDDPTYYEKSGALGIPEFGTVFVRGILEDTHPSTFFELAKICGVAHGTNVWNNNAQDLIRNKTCTLMESICVRDEIMTHLIKCGLESEIAFNITEKVRKGKGLTEKHEAVMRENNVPEWYIESCKKISYMFPLAHSVAYVMMSFRIAYYKVHYPLAFYASFFSSNIENFDAELILAGKEAIDNKIKDFQSFANKKEKSKEQGSFYVLELAREMMARGYTFKACDIYKSEADVFTIEGNSLLMPIKVVPRLGMNSINNLIEYRKNNEIYSIDDLRKIEGISRVAIDNFRALGMLDGLPESSQFTLDMFL